MQRQRSVVAAHASCEPSSIAAAPNDWYSAGRVAAAATLEALAAGAEASRSAVADAISVAARCTRAKRPPDLPERPAALACSLLPLRMHGHRIQSGAIRILPGAGFDQRK